MDGAGRVVSVNVGTPRVTEWHGRLVESGIWKEPVDGRVAVRGVNVDGVMRTLVARGLVEEAGRDEGMGDGGAILYRTTSYFLERLGLNSIDDLPELAPFLPDMDSLDEMSSA
jgi:segregation and condensation protein B